MSKIRPKIRTRRTGNIAVMSVFMLSSLIALVAFAINMGNIANSLAILQNAGDSSAKAAAWELLKNFDSPNAQSQATQQAVNMVQATMVSQGVNNTLVPATDVKYGRFEWDKNTNQYVVTWGTTPANLIQAKLSRIDPRQNALSVILKNVLRRDTVELRSTTNVALIPATGFSLPPESTKKLAILPIALDIDTWIQLEQGAFLDQYSVNTTTNAVTSGSDGKREVKIFPLGNSSLPSGNRGTIRLGANNNSTSKLSRQIREGLNGTDMSYHNGILSVADGPIVIPGDPGISAGIEGDLISIAGQDRILPLFTSVSGNGANCSYTIVKFVGVKVVKVNLRGSASSKELVVQPSNFTVDEAVTNMKMPFNKLGTVFVKPMFIDAQ
jgi:hypothetical protein